MVPAICDINIPGSVYGHSFGILKLPRVLTLTSEAMQKVELRVVSLDSMIKIVGHQKMPLICKTKARRGGKFFP